MVLLELCQWNDRFWPANLELVYGGFLRRGYPQFIQKYIDHFSKLMVTWRSLILGKLHLCLTGQGMLVIPQWYSDWLLTWRGCTAAVFWHRLSPARLNPEIPRKVPKMWEINENQHFHKLVYPRLIYVMAVLNRGKGMSQTILISELVRQYEVKQKNNQWQKAVLQSELLKLRPPFRHIC